MRSVAGINRLQWACVSVGIALFLGGQKRLTTVNNDAEDNSV
jgi:hypothetical protein